jgi:hypothetical protein
MAFYRGPQHLLCDRLRVAREDRFNVLHDVGANVEKIPLVAFIPLGID